jgi:hemerythrin superfamily protein
MQTSLIKGVTATELLKEDHELIKSLFRQVERTDSDRRKKIVGDRCLREIEIHSLLEKKIFYPSVRRDLGDDRLIAQFLVEHEAAERLVNELKGLAEGARYNTRFRALRQIVEPHIEAEEADLLPLVESSDMDIEQLGQQMLELKRRVEPSGFEEERVRNIAAAVTGVAVLGGLAWLAGRYLARRAR